MRANVVGVVVAVVVVLAALYFAAYGNVPVPDSVRNLWDKAYEKQVEPRKKDLERELERARDTAPPSPRFQSFGPRTSPHMSVLCRVPCPAIVS